MERRSLLAAVTAVALGSVSPDRTANTAATLTSAPFDGHDLWVPPTAQRHHGWPGRGRGTPPRRRLGISKRTRVARSRRRKAVRRG